MIHDIDAIYDHGILRPTGPLPLREGARVHLRVEEENGRAAGAPGDAAAYEAWVDAMAGRWEGDFVRGDEGDFDSRESLS